MAEERRDAAQPAGAPAKEALVSIVVPCCGQVEHTRLSVPRLLRHSRPPFELIFVDAGSLDGTPDYLAGVADAAAVRVEVVCTSAEAAFGAAVMEGLARARGAYVAWVNNDVLVPPLWLSQLVALAGGNATLGMVGPMANVAPEGQRVAVPYRLRAGEAPGSLETGAVDEFAKEHRAREKGAWAEVEHLGGFCFLAKREVLAKVPLLDDGAGPGVFDAGALCARARRAGHRLGVCRDLYVHHFGSKIA